VTGGQTPIFERQRSSKIFKAILSTIYRQQLMNMVLSNVDNEVGCTWHSPPHSRVVMFCITNSSSQFLCPTLPNE